MGSIWATPLRLLPFSRGEEFALGHGAVMDPHMLRHTFASLEDRKRAGQLRGSPLLLVKELLGHASIKTTSRYLHFIDAIDDWYATRYQAEIDAIAAGLLKPAQGNR